MQISLAGGSYKARSVIASAQRCLNLIPEPPEPWEQGQPFPNKPWTYYPAPGLTLFAQDPTNKTSVRGIYYPANGGGLAYVVVGTGVYSINVTTGALAYLGAISSSTGPVSMQDNTLVLVICDGSANGWYVTLSTGALTQISDPAFYGATSIALLDTFLIFSKPNSNQWYSSPSNYIGNSTPFDGTYIATKGTYSDNIAGLVSINQLIWLIGEQTTELWYDAGNTDFPFARVPEVLIHHGTWAPASIATTDGGVFWLSQDIQGTNMVLHGQGYTASRVSIYPIEYEWSRYGTTSDAIGMTYQLAGHIYYEIVFPTAGKAWVYDLDTQQWHERCSLDSNGNEARHFPNCAFAAGSNVLIGDYQNGTIYRLDEANYTDNGTPIKRQRAFPHQISDGNRVFHRRFMADLSPVNYPPGSISFDWSDDRGVSYGTPVAMSLGVPLAGGFTWWRLGYARDRVYRLTWTAPVEMALRGAWLNADSGAS